MRTKCLFLTWLLGASLVFVQQIQAQTQQTPGPVLFFSDLISGPNSGGQTVNGSSGAFVTLYGNFFGSSQGNSTVTWNGLTCLQVLGPTGSYTGWGMNWLWYQKIIIQLGSGCGLGTGNFVVTVNGVASNGLPFTVNSGHLYFVSTKGSDNNSGSYSSPWATIPHAVQTAGAGTGNIIYALAGVQATTDDGQGWDAALTMRDAWCHGTASAPNALIAYPGATGTVQIGCTAAGCSPSNGFRSTDYSGDYARGFWTFSGINFRSGTSAAVGISGGTQGQTNCTSWNGGLAGCESRGWRFVGNDVSNANSSSSGGGGAAFHVELAIQSQTLGNYIHDISLNSTSRLDQGLYLSTDANYDEIGWNEIYNNKGRAGIQTHSSNLCWPSCSGDQTGLILHDLSIHDNKIHHINEEGILVDTVDPSIGSGVKVYNNVVYDAGLDGNGDTTHFQLSGDFNLQNGIGKSPAPVWWYNNTVVCSNGNGCWGDWFPDIHSGTNVTNRVSNNIFYSTGSTAYLDVENYSGSNCNNTDTASICPTASGIDNILYGNGGPSFPNLLTNSLNSNPLFVSVSTFDLHLQTGSPAIGAGLPTIQDITASKSVSAPIYDIDGRGRPNPPSIGAYEFGSGLSRPNPPTNLTVVVEQQ